MFDIKHAGQIGIAASIVVGIGEFLLHYSPQVLEINDSFAFLAEVPLEHMVIGHFFVLIGIPLYFIGYYHLYLMLRGGSEKISKIFYMISCIAFLSGGIWIASRGFIGHIIQAGDILSPEMYEYIKVHYFFFFESLLSILRYLLFVISILWVYLIATKKTYYPVWMIACNPIVLLLLVFTSLSIPSIGKYMIPIALNIVHLILFSLSLYIYKTSQKS